MHEALCSRAHPLVKAGNFLTEMYIRRPFRENNERIGYLVANFLLLRAGYPPIILFRRVFSTVVDYHRRFRELCQMDEQMVQWGMPSRMPPALRAAFLNACVIRAVVRSCRYGLLFDTIPASPTWHDHDSRGA